MPRSTNAVASKKRKKKIFKHAKGFVGGRGSLLRTAKETVARAMAFATRDRKQRKRQFRQLWNVRVNAACRADAQRRRKLTLPPCRRTLRPQQNNCLR